MLLPYIGEKTKLSSFIIPHIPKDITTYVEPFGGMFGIFFSLNFMRFKDVKFIYNDINFLNSNLFNQLKENDNLIEEINQIKVNKELYSEVLNKLFTEKDTGKLAIYWLIILTCSYPNKIGENSWLGDSEFEIFKLKFRAYKYHIDKIDQIHNWDYKKIISKYDSESTFFYVDPPYMGKENYYINHNFEGTSHEELAKTLHNIKGRFILSYWYFDGIESLYPWCNIEKKSTLMGTEFLIKNY